MHIGVLETYYRIFAIGKNEEEVLKNLLKGYKKTYPKKEERTITNPKNAWELIEYFGGGIHQIKDGFASE